MPRPTPSARTRAPRRPLQALVLAAGVLLLAGCDALGIDTPEKVAAAREADGRAIGGACRHAGRAIEDCFVLYRKADRAAVFAGWRDMNDYMRENRIEAIAPVIAGQPAAAPRGGDDAEDDSPEPRDTPKKVARAGR